MGAPQFQAVYGLTLLPSDGDTWRLSVFTDAGVYATILSPQQCSLVASAISDIVYPPEDPS